MKIDGFTFKKIGIIFINKIFKRNETNNEDIKLSKFIINVYDKILTEFKEIIVHYLSTIFNANFEKVGLIQSTNDKNYNNNFDERDKFEDILLGNKILYLTIESSLFLL